MFIKMHKIDKKAMFTSNEQYYFVLYNTDGIWCHIYNVNLDNTNIT